jgi:membrane protease YdiL (CAAX protease family)
MKQNSFSNQILLVWNRKPLIVRAVLNGLLVSSAGIAFWSLMLAGLPVPWPILPMIPALWVYLKFFGGSWGSIINRESRKTRFRAIKLPSSVWKWGITGAVFFVIVVQASFVITFRIIDFPSEKFTADYKTLDNMPLWVAWAVLIMSSVVAGICEETGFRGYMQVPIEKRYGPAAGIVISSVIFTLIHLSHSWASPILPNIFFASVLLGILAYKTGSLIPGIIGHSILDIFDYSVWWSDISGGFHRQTIFVTGIDIHFVVWTLVFMLAVFMFFRSMNRLTKWKPQIINPFNTFRLNFK